MNQAFALSPEDTRLLDQAEELAGNETPGGLMLNLGELTQLLAALAGHPRVALGRNPPLAVSATAALPLADYALANETVRLSVWKVMWLLAAITVATSMTRIPASGSSVLSVFVMVLCSGKLCSNEGAK
jgi:hypothetical protein